MSNNGTHGDHCSATIKNGEHCQNCMTHGLNVKRKHCYMEHTIGRGNSLQIHMFWVKILLPTL